MERCITAGALKDALNEVLVSVIGNEARVCVWKYLRECQGMTADDLNTVEKMQQALQLVFGSMAKPLASMAFARYMDYRRGERVQEKELDQNGAAYFFKKEVGHHWGFHDKPI